MDLSVIIPTYNESAYLPKLLASLEKQKYTGKLDVIIVDCHSRDNTVKEAEKFKNTFASLRILTSKKDIGYQKNLGANHAKFEHILFLDADVILPKNLLNRFVAKINPVERLVDNLMLISYPLTVFGFISSLIGNIVLFFVSVFEPAMIGPFIFTTVKNHNNIGGFKEGTIIGEDLDYVIRSVKDGARHHMRLDLYVFNSSRRVKKMGRVRFVYTWLKAYFYVKKHGPIYKNFTYPFGDF